MSFRGILRLRRQDPIRLLARRHNYFPKKFMWRGRTYNVYSVIEAWTEMRRKEGTFEIYQDLHLNAWYLAKQGD